MRRLLIMVRCWLFFTVCFCCCTQKPINYSSDTESTMQNTYYDITVTNDPSKTGVTDISSAKIQGITKEMTYEDIFELLGETKDFGFLKIRIYTVDADKLLVIRFDALEQVGGKSGEELLQTAIPLVVPAKAVELLDKNQYGKFEFMVDGGSFFCIEELECYNVWLSKATVTDQNGNAFSADNVENMTYLFVQYNSVMESYPAILDCTEVVVFNN